MYNKEYIKKMLRDIGIEPKESYFKESEDLYTCFNIVLGLYVTEKSTMEIALRTEDFWKDYVNYPNEIYKIEKYKGE